MPSLVTLKKQAALYHRVTVADLTVDGHDMFLAAANNAKDQAQSLNNFELSRVVATLSIDGESGGALADAIIAGGSTVDGLVITGTLSPDVTGTWKTIGTKDDSLVYALGTDDGIFTLEYAGSTWFISNQDGDTLWSSGVSATPYGDYTPSMPATGTLTVEEPTTAFSGLREITNVSQADASSQLIPLNFTNPDVALERTRTELELSDDYAANMRYPSDADILNRHGNSTITQRGGRLFIFPLDPDSTAPLAVTLEGYGQLADYTAADLVATTPRDFLLANGGTWMQWAIVCELNYYFKSWVTRNEGNLAPPEKERDTAWRNLLLWDTYLVDSHVTRPR